MSTRRILALLVVLALSLGLCSVTAGSATLQRPSGTDDTVISDTTFKDGDDGEDIDGGDDDRWGNTNTIGGNNGDPDTAGDDEDDEGDDNVRMLGRLGMLQVELRALFGFLVMML